MVNELTLSQRVGASRLARVAALPRRFRDVSRYNFGVSKASARWLVTSREHTNYTYDLTELNMKHLAWWVSAVTGAPVADCRQWMQEILHDDDFQAHVAEATARSSRRGLADREVRLGRRIGWYALIRALRPNHVVETGTDKGLGAVCMAAALRRNGCGHLTTIDVNPLAGYLISAPYSERVTLVRGSSLDWLRSNSDSIDFFLHDSDHSPAYERAELESLAPHLLTTSVVLTDNAEMTDELQVWAETSGRQFLFFGEESRDHWFRGTGIGAAWYPQARLS